MSQTDLRRYVLSVDELGLCFSLINRPDYGRSIMQAAVGVGTDEDLKAYMVAASHSLMARDLIESTDSGSVSMDEPLQWALLPLASFQGMIQVTGAKDLPEAIQVYLGEHNAFTAHWVDRGVVQYLVHGKQTHLPELIMEWISIPDFEGRKLKKGAYSISMEILNRLNDLNPKEAASVLKSSGLSDKLAEQLGKDVADNPRQGSILCFDVSSESSSAVEDPEATNAHGLLFMVGAERSWVYKFPNIADDAVGEILLGKPGAFIAEIKALLSE